MTKKNIGTIILFAGGYSVLNGLGNYFFKEYSSSYLLFMSAIGVGLIALGIYLRK